MTYFNSTHLRIIYLKRVGAGVFGFSLAFSLTFFLAFVLFQSEPSYGVSNKPIVGRVGYAKGNATIDGETVKAGAPIRMGSVVQTGEGKMTILLGTETIMHVDRETRLIVDEFLVKKGRVDRALINLKYGKTRSLIRARKKNKNKFRLRTRSATMGVRGTEIFVNAHVEGSIIPDQFMTLAGEAFVQFAQPKGASPDSAPKPVTIKPGQIFNTAADGGNSTGKDGAKGGLSKISTKEGRAMANEVAPPAGDIRTKDELKEVAEGGDPFAPSSGPKRPNKPPLPPNITFDPTADSNTNVNLNITLQKQN